MTKKTGSPGTVLILGASGMLGSEFLIHLPSINNELQVIGTTRKVSRELESILKPNSKIISGVNADDKVFIEEIIRKEKPTHVINCIGVIKQSEFIGNDIGTIEINSILPRVLSDICEKNDARFIHFSTDCVFSGKDGNYQEIDVEDASDVYGRSKLLGEIRNKHSVTLRTSIIGHEIASNKSLIDWFLTQDKNTRGYKEAIFSGLPTRYVVEIVNEFLLNKENYGELFHLSVAPIDKYSLLTLVKEIYKTKIDIEMYRDFKIDRSLNSDKFRQASGFRPNDWRTLVELMHESFLERKELGLK